MAEEAVTSYLVSTAVVTTYHQQGSVSEHWIVGYGKEDEAY